MEEDVIESQGPQQTVGPEVKEEREEEEEEEEELKKKRRIRDMP